MNHFRSILRHELTVAVRSIRTRVLFIVALTLSGLASVAGTTHYLLDVRDREQLLLSAEQEWLHQDPKAPHPANHFGRWVIKPIEPLSIFERGVEDFVGQRIVLDAHVKTPLVGSVGEEDPWRALLCGFDLSFVASVIFPLLLIFAAHDVICGEKERGTLRQLLSAPVSRAELFAAKYLALVIVAAACLGLPTVLGFCLPVCFGVHFEPREVHQLSWMLGGLGLYLAFFLGLSIAASASCATRATALASLLGLWLVSVFLLPKTAELVAATIHPAIPPLSLHRTQQQLGKELAEHRAEQYRTVLDQLRKQHPEIPEDFGTMGHDGGRSVADASWSVDPTGVFISEANAMINERRDAALEASSAAGRQQQALATNLAQASPTFLLMSIWSRLAATDWEHHQWFERAVNRYFEHFGRYFNELWARNVKELRDFSGAPRFEYEREPDAVMRSRAVPPILLLAAAACVAMVIGLHRLKGYDAR